MKKQNKSQKKERTQQMREWPSAEKQFSEYATLKTLMTTLPEVDANADEEWKRKRIEYAPCLNFH